MESARLAGPSPDHLGNRAGEYECPDSMMKWSCELLCGGEVGLVTMGGCDMGPVTMGGCDVGLVMVEGWEVKLLEILLRAELSLREEVGVREEAGGGREVGVRKGSC